MQALKEKLSAKKEQQGGEAPPVSFGRLAALNRPEWRFWALGLVCAAAAGLQVGCLQALCSMPCSPALREPRPKAEGTAASTKQALTSGSCMPLAAADARLFSGAVGGAVGAVPARPI